MVFRRNPFHFCHRRTKLRSTKYIINDAPTTYNDAVYPQIPFKIRSKPYRIKNIMENNLKGQLYNLTFSMTALFRDERILLNYNRASELRPYAERLIVEAMRNGDCHRPTMELANYWLREKNLVHKLFKVFVPRYSNYPSSFTAIHLLGMDYTLSGMTITELRSWSGSYSKSGQAVLEMKGNSLPKIIRPKLSKPGLLTNILLDGARESRLLETKSIETRTSQNEVD